MILTAILNAILAMAVTLMVVTPLVWAILTQHRDHPRPAATDRAIVRPAGPQPHRPSSEPWRKPVVGRA